MNYNFKNTINSQKIKMLKKEIYMYTRMSINKGFV